ncbi:MAG: rhodanese-like domain-containing protein [Clostridia bacterium]|nr:rhodanese-like domain-containing protein [Clostridia bacterium]
MKKKLIAMVLPLLCIGITACSAAGNGRFQIESKNSPSQNNPSEILRYTDINPQEAKKRLESEEGIILLDVRTQEEYEEKHIPGSLLIPVDIIEKEAPSKLTDKNANIFVYCRSGRRSITASEALVKMGYTKVYNLGGIIDWPYETASGK